ncbi:hypothetical protein CMI37_09095 [Candidatus Pacearchaeota archaeon]|nr:hypothetical protein [Candidatus Pacearchaeota archaeon]
MPFKLKQIKLNEIKSEDRFREDLGDIHELAENIREKGVITPITVDEDMNLVAGGRRVTAARLADLKTIPAVIRKIEGPQDAREIELFENIHRKDMNWSERSLLEYEIYCLESSKNPKWNKSKQAEMLSVSHTSVGRHITLAVALQIVPELVNCKTEEEAWKKWHGVKEQLAIAELSRRITYNMEGGASAEEAADKAAEGAKPKEYTKKERLDQQSQAAVRFADGAYIVGDTLELIKKVKSKCCHFAEVDPPYGIKLQKQRGRVADQHTLDAYNEISAVDYPAFLQQTAVGVYEALVDKAFCVWWFGPTWYDQVRKALGMAGFKIADIPAIWYKGQIGQTNSPETHLANSYEMFFVCRKGAPALNKRGRSNVFHFDPVPPRQKVHPTERPIELMEEILATFTYPNSRILVPFLGSGVTLRAIYKNQLKGFGWDLSEHSRNLYLEKVLEDVETEKRAAEAVEAREKSGRTRGQPDQED